MDTMLASPKHASSKAPSLLGVALSVATALWLAVVTTEIANAEPPPKETATVTYADLDPSTAHGARALLGRIERAAREVCGPAPVHSPLLPRAAAYYRKCVVASVDAAAARIGSPALLALHEENQSTASVALAAR